MQSIFSVQNENTIIQTAQAKKQEKEDKKVQFANVAFGDFIGKTRKILKSAVLTDNLSTIYQNSTHTNNSFKGLNSFTLNFKTDSLPQNTKTFEYSEELFAKLNELVENYKGVKSDLQDAERFLLSLMKEVASEIEELGFDNVEFIGYYEAYYKQLSEKKGLKSEIVELASKYLDETDSFKAERLLNSLETKLREYYSASQDGDLRNFFAPLLPYLNDNAQENIVKALYTINEELKNPEAFELGGGNKLVWEVDGERIKFKILSNDDLQSLHAERQKSKSFKTIKKSFENGEVSESEAKLNENAELNLALNASLNLNANSTFFNSAQNFGTNLALYFNMLGNTSSNSQANANAQSLLKGLLKD